MTEQLWQVSVVLLQTEVTPFGQDNNDNRQMFSALPWAWINEIWPFDQMQTKIKKIMFVVEKKITNNGWFTGTNTSDCLPKVSGNIQMLNDVIVIISMLTLAFWLLHVSISSLSPSPQVRSLGVFLHGILSFHSHINNITESAYFHLQNMNCPRRLPHPPTSPSLSTASSSRRMYLSSYWPPPQIPPQTLTLPHSICLYHQTNPLHPPHHSCAPTAPLAPSLVLYPIQSPPVNIQSHPQSHPPCLSDILHVLAPFRSHLLG